MKTATVKVHRCWTPEEHRQQIDEREAQIVLVEEWEQLPLIVLAGLR